MGTDEDRLEAIMSLEKENTALRQKLGVLQADAARALTRSEWEQQIVDRLMDEAEVGVVTTVQRMVVAGDYSRVSDLYVLLIPNEACAFQVNHAPSHCCFTPSAAVDDNGHPVDLQAGEALMARCMASAGSVRGVR